MAFDAATQDAVVRAVRQAPPSLLAKWRLATSKAVNGTAPAKLLWLGESLVNGSGAAGGAGYNAGGRAKNAVVETARLLAAAGVSSRADCCIGTGGILAWTTFDGRYANTGWTVNTSINYVIGGTFSSTTNGAKLSFTPDTAFDRIEVFYLTNPGHGTFIVDVDGGASLGTVSANAAVSITSQTFSCALGTHTVNLTKTSTSNNHVVGIRTYNSAAPQVEIIQAGIAGGKVAQFAYQTNNWDALYQIGYIAPDLTIIQVGVNDWLADTGVAAVTASYQSVIDKCKLSGDVLVIIEPASAVTNTPLERQAQYVSAIKQVAAANGCTIVDLWSRYGTKEASAGYYADDVHLNGPGYKDVARAVVGALLV